MNLQRFILNKIYYLGAKASNILDSKRKLSIMGTDQFDSMIVT